jgi:hypothetical protein
MTIEQKFASETAAVKRHMLALMGLYVAASAQAESTPLKEMESAGQRARLIAYLDKRHVELGIAYKLIMAHPLSDL